MKKYEVTKTDRLVTGAGGVLLIGGLALACAGVNFGSWIALAGLGVYALYALWIVIHAMRGKQ